MLLSEIFDQLEHGELSTIAMGGANCKGIPTEEYSRIIANINLGLLELYKRFNIKMGELVLVPDASITDYLLDSAFAQSNTASGEPIKYIQDTPEKPFTDDLLKIETVRDVLGEKVHLNDPSNLASVFTPDFKTLRIKYPEGLIVLDREHLTVTYRLKPAMIPSDTLDLHMYDLFLPYTFMEALLLYVGSRIHTNLNIDGGIGEGNNYYTKFEAACRKITELGLTNYSEHTNSKLEKAGWV